MARITVLIDDIIKLSQGSIDGEPKPSKVAALCDLAGAGGVAVQVKDSDMTPEHERIIKGLKEVLGIPLALIIPSDNRAIEKAIDLAPAMVVLADTVAGDGDYISRLQVANIIVAIGIAPDLDQVKAAAKMKGDYIAIDVSSYCVEKNLSVRVDILNKISKAAALAERLNIGVIITGPVSLIDIAKLAEIGSIEDFFIGHAIISKAIMFGLEDAVAEFRAEANRF